MWEFHEPLRGNFSLDRDLPTKLEGRVKSALPEVEERYTFSSLFRFETLVKGRVVLWNTEYRLNLCNRHLLIEQVIYLYLYISSQYHSTAK